MAHMLAMTAIQLCHPMAFVILVEADYAAFHRILRKDVSRSALRPGTTLRNRIRP